MLTLCVKTSTKANKRSMSGFLKSLKETRKIKRTNGPDVIEDVFDQKYQMFLEEVKEKTDWKPGEDVLPKIPNFVTHFYLGVSFRLTDIPLHFPNSDYRPEEFAAATIRDRKSVGLAFENGQVVLSGAKSTPDVQYTTAQDIKQLSSLPQLVRVMNEDGSPMEVTVNELEPSNTFNKRHFLSGASLSPDPFITGIKYRVYAISTLEKVIKFTNSSLVNVVGSGIGSTKRIKLALMSVVLDKYCSPWEPDSFPGLKFVIHQKYCPITLKECTAHIFDSGATVFMGAPCKEDVINLFMFTKCIIKQFEDEKTPVNSSFNKYYYRMKELQEINKMIGNISMDERINLANTILETASEKCFGSYMYDYQTKDEEMETTKKQGCDLFGRRQKSRTHTSRTVVERKIDIMDSLSRMTTGVGLQATNLDDSTKRVRYRVRKDFHGASHIDLEEEVPSGVRDFKGAGSTFTDEKEMDVEERHTLNTVLAEINLDDFLS